MTTTIDKYNDTIDSRDVIARIEELTAERDAMQETIREALADLSDLHGDLTTDTRAECEAQLAQYRRELIEWDSTDELAALEALAKEAEGYANDWQDGVALIRYSYFKNYAMELAEDTGALKSCAEWPHTCIDWDQAARELQMDYTSVDFDDVTYWVC